MDTDTVARKPAARPMGEGISGLSIRVYPRLMIFSSDANCGRSFHRRAVSVKVSLNSNEAINPTTMNPTRGDKA